MPGYTNLPGIHPTFEDGNLSVVRATNNPIVVVLGTAARGDATTVYDVPAVSDAISRFGRLYGTLPRGTLEVDQGGALSIKCVRIGAKAAKLVMDCGYTVETVERDETAGLNVKLYLDNTTGRLRIWRVSDDLLVYDNNPTYPTGAVDEYMVGVTGTFAATGSDVGSLATPLNFLEAENTGEATYTAGTDGIQLSRMELFEALYEGYIMLENDDMDFVVPRDVYLDDSSVCDMTTAQVATLNTTPPWDGAPTTYPTRGTAYDVLGEVYVQEYNGQYYFWWDMDRDGIAEIYPSGIGSADGSHNCDGTALAAADFHEANFGYQLANFCYQTTEDEVSVRGVIGVKPPVSWAPKDVSNWIGKVPTYTEDSNGNLVISSSSNNGTGLLGIKWMAGRKGNTGTGLPGFTVDGLEGLAYGGFIATDDGWPDGTQLKDNNDHLVDIGKYLIVTGAYALMSNSTAATSYMSNISSIYAGFVSSLPSNEAGTNQIFESVRLAFNIKNSKLDTLAGYRYTMLKAARKGLVVADAPTAARPDSDYQRQMTVSIVNAVIEAIRDKTDPFIGKGVLSGARAVALDTTIEGVLSSFVPSHLERYEKNLSFTKEQKIRGEATLKLKLVTVGELRHLIIEVSLSAT